jgi:dethiobiotin synthetase
MKQFFITATDTDAGKTFASCALIHALTLTKEKKVAAYKPISAGCELIDGVLINEDARLLSGFANCGQNITHINPIAFKQPIAPHIAAKKQNIQITLTQLTDHYESVKSLNADVTLVEGAGGWRLPLGYSLPEPLMINANLSDKKPRYQFLSDFVKNENLRVILIVNMKLGCLNHALLTYETIKADGLDCVAWIANCAASESMSNLSENISELELLLPIPKIAQFDYIHDVDEEGNDVSFYQKINHAAKSINLAPLLA